MTPPEEIPESFGSYLKREREFREITLEEIAAYTRIKFRALEAIERDDFASLPALAFIRAFIRCYADYLGLNLPDVMLRFDAFIQNRYPELTGETPIIPKKPRPKQRYLPLIFIILAVLLIAFVYWLKRPPSSGSEKPGPSVHETTKPGPGLASPANTVLAMGPAYRLTGPPTHPGTTVREGLTTGAGPTPPTPVTPPGPAPLPANTLASPPVRPVTPIPGPTAVPSVPHPLERPRNLRPLTSSYREPLGPPRALATMPAGHAPTPTPAEPAPPEPTSPADYKHRVTIQVKQPCWIQYTLDNDGPHNFMLQPEKAVELQAVSSVKIKVGNPDSVIGVKYNGQALTFKAQCSPWWLNFPAQPGDNSCPTNPGPP